MADRDLPHPTRCRDEPTAEPPGGHGWAAGWVATAALVLAALNLRPAVTSLGPVLEEVRASLGMSGTVAGLLTSLPAVCFALVGLGAPRLAGRYGANGVVAAGIMAIAAGLAVRPIAGGSAVFIALTGVALAGIAVVNVLLPAVVKQHFPARVGAMTGLYSMALSLGAAIAGAATVPLAGALGGDWRAGLGGWAVPAALAVPAWLALARRPRPPVPVPAAAMSTASGPTAPITRSLTAWALAVYFGLQATAAYVIIGWLPQIFRDAGLSADTAGLLFAVTALLGVPLAAALGAVAGRLPSHSGLAVAIGLFGLAGYAGLWAAPATTPWLWATLLGLANTAFPLALTMIGMRGADSATVIRLSTFAQSTGYLLSVPGPILVGALYQHTHGWHLPLAVMAGLMIPQLAAGFLAGRNRRIGPPAR